jgi:hypothetical protein
MTEREAKLFLVIPYDTPKDCAAAYDGSQRARAHYSPRGTQWHPTSKSVIITEYPHRSAEIS